MATAAASQAKTKKTASSKKAPSHPTFVDMITDAIVSLKERTGSSQYAITKFIEEKHKTLPPTFRKLLLQNLKKAVAAGKLVKVKNSFKLAPKASAPAKPKAATKPAASKPKAKAASAAAPKKKAVAKPKAKAAGSGAVKPKVKAVAAKKVAAKAVAAKKVVVKAVKKTPVKKPKSVKSPAKKPAVKNAAAAAKKTKK